MKDFVKKTKKGFAPAEDTKIASAEINFVLPAGKTPSEQTKSKFPSYGAAAAEQTGRQKAFTLAEVLIALTIIGVIAAITVPALIQRTNKQEYVTALQKAYSTLSQATNQIIAENGSPKGDDSWLQDEESLYEMYKKYLDVYKGCGTEKGCYPQNESGRFTTKRLSGSKESQKYPYAGNNYYVKYAAMILTDGTQVLLRPHSLGNACSGSEMNYKVCALITADINGVKGPNQWGRDLFLFTLKEDGLYPAGCDYNRCDAKSSTETVHSGYGCACKVLRDGAMNY